MKKVFHFVIVILIGLLFAYFPLIKYGVDQASGQLKIIWQAEPIEEFIKNDLVPDSIKQKLEFIQEVRHYAVDSLGLNESNNYTTIYDQKGQPSLWVVTGSKPFELVEKKWKFPVLGSVPYKGFFDLKLANKEFQKVKEEGFDAGIRTVGGWSTLGWFTDPILTNMLNRSNGDLANLIIHELVHSTVFVKDSVEFNENLASFIADKSAIKFMASKFGPNSVEFKNYLNEQSDEKMFIDHILQGVDSLELLYNKTQDMPLEVKQRLKEKLISRIMVTTDTLSLKNGAYLMFLKGIVPNNTYFMSFMRYRSKHDVLDSVYSNKFNGKIMPFISHLKKKHPYL